MSDKVPAYLQEGKAFILGARYAQAHGFADDFIDIGKNNLPKVNRDGVLKAFQMVTLQDENHLADDNVHNTSKLMRADMVGALFIEFVLRTKGGDGPQGLKVGRDPEPPQDAWNDVRSSVPGGDGREPAARAAGLPEIHGPDPERPGGSLDGTPWEV